MQIKFQYRFLFFWKKLDKQLRKGLVKGGVNSVGSWVKWLTEEITPKVLEVAMHQQYAETIIRKKLADKLNEEEIEVLLVNETGNEGDKDKESLLTKYGHRAFQELELASPRFSENPDLLKGVFTKNTNTEVIKKSRELRRIVISKLPSILDQQTLASTLYLYDKYSKQRERMHDEWVKTIAFLRSALLEIDKNLSLYNSIWYAELGEVLHEKKLSPAPLFFRKARFVSLSRINMPAQLELKEWSELKTLLAYNPAKSGENTLVGIGVSLGLVQGMVGTMEDIQKGKTVDILLHKSLDPSLVLVFGRIKAVITEVGGALSHAAIIAREYGIPVVVVHGAMEKIKSNSNIEVNGTLGTVVVLKKE